MPETPTAGQPGSATPSALLSLENVSLQFGGLKALNDVSFEVREGEILGLIGPNGAGKTTCFNVMTGVYQPTAGLVRFAGEPLGNRKRFAITRLGIARTFQNIRLFPNMTALENVLVGADAHHRTNVVDALFRRLPDVGVSTVLRGGRKGLPLELERVRIAGDGFHRMVVVAEAVEAGAEDFPDEQAAPRLEHANIARRVGVPPRAVDRLVAEAPGVVHCQPGGRPVTLSARGSDRPGRPLPCRRGLESGHPRRRAR